MQNLSYGTYGFQFQSEQHLHLPLCQLFAVGHDLVSTPDYVWDGMKRTDGPLLLFQYTISGRGTIQLDEQTYSVEAETAFLVEIPSKHLYRFVEENEHWRFIFILIRPHTLMPIWNDIIEKVGRFPSLPHECEPIQKLIQLYLAAKNDEINHPYIASEHVYSFFMSLAHYCEGTHMSTFIPDAIAHTKDWIDHNFANMIGQDQLAQRAGFSKYYFIRQFKKYIGLTPHDYVNRKRIEKSFELLLSTTYSLDDIARQIGYSNASYYIRVFRKLTGHTPTAFRSSDHQLQYVKIYFN